MFILPFLSRQEGIQGLPVVQPGQAAGGVAELPVVADLVFEQVRHGAPAGIPVGKVVLDQAGQAEPLVLHRFLEAAAEFLHLRGRAKKDELVGERGDGLAVGAVLAQGLVLFLEKPFQVELLAEP